QVALVEAYAKAQGLWRDPSVEASYSSVLTLDMAEVQPSLAGPKRPQDRVLLGDVKQNFRDHLGPLTANRNRNGSAETRLESEGGGTAIGNQEVLPNGQTEIEIKGQKVALKDGAVVIAAITSCTNTSNPAVMLGAGLLARNAVARGLKSAPWVKTSLGPGS